MDLAQYHAVAGADDLELLRRAQAAERLRVIGMGHGTAVALATVRKHGGAVERLVLAGV